MSDPLTQAPSPLSPADPDAPPRSATHATVALAGALSFIVASHYAPAINALFVALLPPGNSPVVGTAATILGLTALGLFAVDLGLHQTHRRASTGIDYGHDDPCAARTGTKFVGLVASLAAVAALYWLLPEYATPFYARYYALLRVLVPAWLVVAPFYLYYVDRHMPEPRDGYWQLGRLVLGKRRDTERAVLAQHALGWLIKAFFLPLMFTYYCNDLERLLLAGPHPWLSFANAYDYLYDYLYYVDVGIVSMGYLVALRLTDTHLRSAEPTMLGWVVALVCYEPFWSLVGDRYVAYGTPYPWRSWLTGHPLLFVAWGSAILWLTLVYVWATLSFGARFSNLTHRGIITNGPYRYLKHPAYVSKNLSWWLISVPFLTHGPLLEALRHCVLLLGLNGVYWLRALTEERHLSRDETYRRYAAWVDAQRWPGGWRRR